MQKFSKSAASGHEIGNVGDRQQMAIPVDISKVFWVLHREGKPGKASDR